MLIRVITRTANTPVGFFIIKLFLRPEGIFLCYPVESRFADHFASKRRQRKNSWDPYLIGLMWQEGACSVILAISASEDDLRQEASVHQLKFLVNKLDIYREVFGTRRVAMAGILPSLLRARRLRHTGLEVEVTCKAVAHAVLSLLASVDRELEAVVVLGGRGYVGRNLVKKLKDISIVLPIIPVDKGDNLFGYHKALFINCTLPGFIEQNCDQFSSGSVLLNEVYPAPGREAVSRLESNNVLVFHVAGLTGKVFPRMPGEYRDAVPCCAARPGNESNVIIKRVLFDGI